MTRKQPHHRFLAPHEISPVVEEASCQQYSRSRWFRYRVPSHHFLLIESGRIEARTPDGLFRGKDGDLFCFRSTDWNEYGTKGPTIYYQASIRFAPPPRHHDTPSLAEFGPLPVYTPLGKAFPEMRRVFETFCLEVPQPGVVHVLRLRAAVHEMLAIITSALKHDPSGYQHLDKWERLRLWLDTQLETNLSAAEMARQMNLSRFYFNRVFKQHFGLAPRAYHNHVRLREAARLLRSTERAVKEIAIELGFRDPKVFARLFKRHLGVSPSDIRQGSIPVDEAILSVKGRLFPLNTHLVPPRQTEANWYKRCTPRHAGRDYTMWEE